MILPKLLLLTLRMRSILAHRMMPSEGSVVRIPFGAAAGMKWVIHRDLTPSYHWGLHEKTVQSWVRKLSEAEGIMFDVGANVGFYTLVGAKDFGRVISFEPDPRARSRLDDLIEVNDIKEKVTVDHRALASSDGYVWMDLSGRPEASHIVSEASMVAQKIDSISLKTAFREYGIPNVIKLDAEGASGEILLALDPLPPNVSFIIELHNMSEAAAVAQFVRKHSLQVVSQKGTAVRFGRLTQFVAIGNSNNPKFSALAK